MTGLKIPVAFQQAIAVLLPVAAILIAILVVYPTWTETQQLEFETEEARRELAQLRAIPLAPQDPFRPAEAAIEGEPSRFLGQVTNLVRESGCQMIGLDAQGEAIRGDTARAIRARLTVRGAFPRIRDLIARINRAGRLLAVVDVAVRQDAGRREDSYPFVQADLTLERYVTPPVAAEGAAPRGGAGGVAPNPGGGTPGQ